MRANERIEEIIKEAEGKREQILDRARERAEKEIRKNVREAKIELESDLAKYGASATLRGKHKVLDIKEKLLTEVLVSAIEQIKKKTSTKGYSKILTQLALDGGVALDEEEVELVFPKGHQTKVSVTAISKQISDKLGKKVKGTISKEHIRASGGVLVRTSDGFKWVDNTFEGRLERLERAIRDKIAELLFVGKRW